MRVIMSTAEVAQDTQTVSEPASTRLNAQPKPTIAATAMNTASSRIGRANTANNANFATLITGFSAWLMLASAS